MPEIFLRLFEYFPLIFALIATACQPRYYNADGGTLSRQTTSLTTIDTQTQERVASATYHLNRSIEEQAGAIQNKGSHWAVSIPFASISELTEQLKSASDLKLKNRGEAHITILTPDDLKLLQLTPEKTSRILSIAQREPFSHVRFNVSCLGGIQTGNRTTDPKVFYIVVDSEDILNFRRKIREELFDNSACSSPDQDFCPDHYFPHITIGFTKSDIHPRVRDKIKKNKETCVAPIQLIAE